MVYGNWRKLNGTAVLAAREKRRRQRVKDRPLAEMVAEYLAKGGTITVGEAKWAACSRLVMDSVERLYNGYVPPLDAEGWDKNGQ